MQLDMLVVGAGFAGIYQLYKAREAGMTVRVLEAGEGVGGTWFWNRYPGARCDVESLDYSYSFCRELEEEWEWTERYATQSEILSYINHVVDRFDLRRDIQLDTRVASAHFDEDRALWSVRSEDGEGIVTVTIEAGKVDRCRHPSPFTTAIVFQTPSSVARCAGISDFS